MVNPFYKTFIKRLPNIIDNIDSIRLLDKEEKEIINGKKIINIGYFLSIKTKDDLKIVYNSPNEEIVIENQGKTVFYNHKKNKFYHYDKGEIIEEDYSHESIEKDKDLFNKLYIKIEKERYTLITTNKEAYNKEITNILLRKKEDRGYNVKNQKIILEEILKEYS